MMFLKTIHINKYGKLSSYHLDLDKTTVICEKNGFGKSTICSFIKAMFYGLETATDKTKKFLDRKHYYPFSGGNFGGYIVFDYNGKEYRIERNFDIEHEPDDKMKILVNGNETQELGDVPGLTIFGINKANFERLISITPDKIEITADSDINAKLNNYVENVGEDFDITKVQKKISDYETKLAKEIKALGIDIKNASLEIREQEEIKTGLEDKYSILNKLEIEEKKAKKEYEYAALQSAVIEKWNTYDSKKKEVDDKANEIAKYRRIYPNGFPDNDEIEELKNIKREMSILESNLSKPEITIDKKGEYEKLKARYGDNIPDRFLLDEVKTKTDEYEKLGKEIEEFENREINSREKELEYHFKDIDIDEKVIQKLEDEVKCEKELEKEIADIPKKITIKETVTVQEKKKPNKGLFIALIILSLALAGVGIAFISKILVLGISLLALGIILLIFDMFIYFTSSVKNISAESEKLVEQDNPDYANKNAELVDQKHKVEKIFARYRYEGEDHSVLSYRVNGEFKEYTEILSLKAHDEEVYLKNKETKKEIEKELNGFFSKYALYDFPYAQALETVKEEISTYARLANEISEAKAKREIENKKNEEYRSKYKAFYEGFGLSENKDIEEFKADIIVFEKLEQEYAQKAKEAEEYYKNNKLETKPDLVDYDLELLKQNSDDKTREYIKYKQSIEADEAEIENLDELKSKVSENNVKLTELKDEAELYKALSEEIANADQTLKDKYIGPVKKKFEYYASLIEETLGQNLSMDKNYRISFDVEGGLRSSEHLSSGYYAICALCFRLAILDNMFEDSQPFVIMDDPFTYLDKEHMEKASELVSKLSGNRQIIYFTCHESRKI